MNHKIIKLSLFTIPILYVKVMDKKDRYLYFMGIKVAKKSFVGEFAYFYFTLFNFNIQLFRKKRNKFDYLYEKRYTGLSYDELKYCVQYQLSKNAPGETIDIDHPKTFREKLNWLKVNYHDPRMALCADKASAQEWVKSKLGAKAQGHLVRQYGVFDSFQAMNFDEFPEKYILKSNFGSSAQIIVNPAVGGG